MQGQRYTQWTFLVRAETSLVLEAKKALTSTKNMILGFRTTLYFDVMII